MIVSPYTRILLVAIAVAFPAILHAAEPAKSALQRAQDLAQSGNMKGAVELLKTEAGKGSAEAANAVGELHLVGQGVKASPAEAARWFKQAADASYPLGMVNLGMLLIKGAEGVPADPDKGQFLIRSAAEEGFAPAQVAMGKQAEKNGEDGGDPVEARSWFEKAAAQENAEGLLAMARFHDQGIAGPRDPAKGFDACHRAARAGSALAMNELGIRYQKGDGVAAEPTNAIGWFTVAAQRGLPAAQVNLGNCFEIGNGVLQDFSLAGTHYAAAAKQQFGPAQYLLAQLYESGRGTDVNLAYAYVYYTLAAKNGTEVAVKKAADLKTKLTAAQIKEAEKMIADGGKPPAPEAPGKK